MAPKLAPRSGSSIEWWFVHGWFEMADGHRRDFIASVFRQASRDGNGEGHMLLLSSFDEAKGEHTVRSEVSPGLVDHFLRAAPDELRGAGINRNLVDAFTAEIERGGVPSPILLSARPVSMAKDRLAIDWGDFALDEDGDGIAMRFSMPDDGAVCAMSASPVATWLNDDCPPAGAMAYQSCPRLTLTGTVDGEAIRGEAWMDHQWGDYGWMKTLGASAELLGWDWLGINLDDGTDLIVMVRRNMHSRDAVGRLAVLFAPGELPRTVHDADISPLRQWVSPDSMIAYPVACRIAIPSLGADLVFEPLADGQEIPVFGVTNVIWEGVGRIEGVLGDRPATGRARLELNGYGLILDFGSYQRQWIERIDATMHRFLPRELDDDRLAGFVGEPRWAFDSHAQTAMLATPAWDLFDRGGKHWRPVYGLMLLDALGVELAPYETLVSVISEFIHNGSVIIDDIEDNSATRRGAPTIHRRYGLPTAINAGNQLYFLPLLTLSDHPALVPEQRDAIYRAITTMFVQAHMGQAQDLYWSDAATVRGPAFWTSDRLAGLILQAHAYKTAAAVKTISEIDCIVAGTDERIRKAAMDFGESWGIAFQIFDDIRNFSTRPEWGKTRGEDVLSGKVTYVTRKAVSLLEGAGQAELIRILDGLRSTSQAGDLAVGIELIEQSGAFDQCRADATALVEAAWPPFAEVLPQTTAKVMLRVFVTHLLDSNFDM
ncbi:MAG: polyprenyl synthetase family protein [Bauldia sp.]|uniref:polyprenyl synthetase family protein n=1 Tax=Bauldia sp. TaxID=2575872 RepID=UPI001D205340|nr:polyprenyl synthetase family protein [Bauldia sp.]MCB1496211.1 polyprenyl synthetase family protein [Bauldia sp.]